MTKEQELLNKAAEEIVRLRKRNEILELKFQMFERVEALVLARAPERGGVYATAERDIVSEIDEYLNEHLDDLSASVRKIVTKR